MQDHDEAIRLARVGNWIKALQVAAKIRAKDEYADAISKAWSAKTSPDFYREIGVDPDVAMSEGIAALKARYKL